MTDSSLKNQPRNGAEEIIQAVVDSEVSVCFANPGTSEMHFVAAIDRINSSTQNKLQTFLALHEIVCSGAADGYARMTRKPALTLLHLGPGLANALSNMHNARRAGSPMINIIGDMASWHKGTDPLLNMDIESLASTVSKEVVTFGGQDVYAATVKACEESKNSSCAGESRIITVIVPHDIAWKRKELGYSSSSAPSPVPPSMTAPKNKNTRGDELHKFIANCAAALRQTPHGKLAIYIGNSAGTNDAKILETVGRIASALKGAPIYCENAFSRLDRGVGLPFVKRLPYFPHDAQKTLSQYTTLLLIDARKPVANFGYENGPSHLITQPESNVWEIDDCDNEFKLPKIINDLAHALNAQHITPCVNCCGVFAQSSRPPFPSAGKLNSTALCQVIAALQPENAIIVDESLTSGNAYWEASKGCPQFSHLSLTGGAIGCGIPLAVGAAIACPGRKVINIQADGSAMYSAQGLYTQAREGLDVITVICSNGSYAILKVEMAKQSITPSNGPAAKKLTDISSIDWIAVAKGMGVMNALRTDTCEGFIQALKDALHSDGPCLIEAVL